MGKAVPSTALEGLLSGLAHPVIGLDHFLFVLALGAVVYFFGQRVRNIGVFLAAALIGTVLHVQQATLPGAELWVGASLLVLGLALLAAAPALKGWAATAFFACAGIVHGYAYGESIVGAEQAPLLAYLVGFTAIQFAVALAGFAAAGYADRSRRSGLALNTMGAAASVAGVAFMLLAIAS
jgi:urease accessory protein